MISFMKKLISDERGQDLVEYALLLVFIALAAIAVLPTLGSAINNVFSQSASTLRGFIIPIDALAADAGALIEGDSQEALK